MTPLVFVAVALAGGVGAVARLVVDGVVAARSPWRMPVATMVVNLSGSLVLGVVTGLAAHALLPDDWRLVLGTGMMGGYTTFSTASLETVELLLDRRPGPAALHAVAMVVGCAVLALAGLVLGLHA